MSVLSLEHVSYEVRPHFWSRRRPILHDVSLHIEGGEIFGFLGPNGAGKTTTIKAILGLITPRAGEVELLGLSPQDPQARRRCGYMPERAYFPEQLTARELMLLHGTLAGLTLRAAERKADAVLERVGLATAARERLRGYSKGMLQRAGLAQALIGDPEVVILDEPMSGLDPVGRRDIREIMLETKAAGKTVFFSTHILPDVEMICDRVGIIADGRTRRAGRLADLLGESIERVEITTGPCDDAARAEVEPLVQSISSRGDGLGLEAVDLESANRALDALRLHAVEIQDVHVVRRSLEDLFLSEMHAEEGA